MLSRLNSTYKQSIALIELRYNKMLLPLHLVAGYTTQHGYIGT